MILLNFIFSIIIVLILFIILMNIIKLALKLFTDYDYQNYYLVFPTFLSLGTWSLTFIIWYYFTNYIMNIDIIQTIISIFIKEYNISNNFTIISLVFILIGILFQGLSIYLININYKKLTGNTRFFFKKVLKVKLKDDNAITISENPEKISIFSSIIISILIFIFLILCISLLLFIGKLISNRFTYNIQKS